jgi:hypothetical protein
LSASPIQCKRRQPTTTDRSARCGGRLSRASGQLVEHLKAPAAACCRRMGGWWSGCWIIGLARTRLEPTRLELKSPAVAPLEGLLTEGMLKMRALRRTAAPDPKLSSAVFRVNSSKGHWRRFRREVHDGERVCGTAPALEWVREWEPPMSRVKVSMRALRFISGLTGASAVTTA